MPMISSVGRKANSTRLLIAGLYAVLLLGGLTMIYPFLLLMAGSTKTGVDIKDVAWLPSFLVDDTALYRKHVEALFNEQLDVMRAVYDNDVVSFEKLDPPAVVRMPWVQVWRDFIAVHEDPLAYTIGYMQAQVSRTVPDRLRDFRERVRDQYGPSIDAVNSALETAYTGWNAFYLLPEDGFARRSRPLTTPLGEAWRQYRAQVPEALRYYFVLDGFFKTMFLKTQYTREITEYNRMHGTDYPGYDAIRLPTVWPEAGTAKEREDWENFVRYSLSLEWIRVAPEAAELYRDYLRAKYGTLERVNRAYATAWREWSDVMMPLPPPWDGLVRSDWEAFLGGWTDPDTGVHHQPPVDALRIAGVDEAFRAYVRGRWPELAELNRATGTDFRDWEQVRPPQQEFHYAGFLDQRGSLRVGFLTRNLLTALDHLAFHGRGIRNTIIYCALAVLAALLINPLAAYAMSRYKPPNTYKLLLFLLLTMAFPPMVTQIPVFLMMRDLNLLNTFAALLLPGLAHGYSIFLLKGFFDALPRDLYESAEMDGAGEWTMFWHITMSLSKPILAVVALQAFTTAYANFMFALLICQDEAMWTMMVWLYQLQMTSGPGVIYASLLVAAVPTLIIFIFCQNIILRGIVVPVEK